VQDAVTGSDIPTFITNSTNWNTTIPITNQTISWDVLPDLWDGYSLLVDDVERYLGAAMNYSLGSLDPSIIHFFRIAVSFA
jgi:hypothetical protein